MPYFGGYNIPALRVRPEQVASRMSPGMQFSLPPQSPTRMNISSPQPAGGVPNVRLGGNTSRQAIRQPSGGMRVSNNRGVIPNSSRGNLRLGSPGGGSGVQPMIPGNPGGVRPQFTENPMRVSNNRGVIPNSFGVNIPLEPPPSLRPSFPSAGLRPALPNNPGGVRPPSLSPALPENPGGVRPPTLSPALPENPGGVRPFPGLPGGIPDSLLSGLSPLGPNQFPFPTPGRVGTGWTGQFQPYPYQNPWMGGNAPHPGNYPWSIPPQGGVPYGDDAVSRPINFSGPRISRGAARAL